MFRDHSLCLYDNRERLWDPVCDQLYNTVVPWTAEWLLYYELFLVFGKWLGPEARHHDGEKKLPD